MSESQPQADACLFELGLEELPPKAMPALIDAFASGVSNALSEHALSHGEVKAFAAPRRLAVRIDNVLRRQADSVEVLRGPPVRIGVDSEGNPTKAAEAFAKKCGTTFGELEREETEKGEWLVFRAQRNGQPFADLAQSILETAIEDLPIPKRMRWGDRSDSFVRPLHWLVAMQGSDVLPVTLFGIEAGRATRGHRFHAPLAITLEHPEHYEQTLRSNHVIAEFDQRLDAVRSGVLKTAASLGGEVQEDEALFREIAALVDWPVPVAGEFDSRFLTLPREVLSSTLKVHQRYFPVVSENGEPTGQFITVANIESKDPSAVREGNERVIAPRLADAEFFWSADRQKPLRARHNQLQDVVYQKALGSLGDKTTRVSHLSVWLSEALGIDAEHAATAAGLSRCDLVTDMVGEFPELQGIMGAYYADADGEATEIVEALREFYQPRFAGDTIAATPTGRVLTLADKLDTLAGIFAIGKRPTGNRDPFGLRRAALGVIRTIIEGGLEVDLVAAIQVAVEQQPVDVSSHPELADDVYDFVIERLRHYELSSTCAGHPDWFEAVVARSPHSLLDFHQRLTAVAAFVDEPAAAALAAANKRIANILRGAGNDAHGDLQADGLKAPAEQALYAAWAKVSEVVAPLVSDRRYSEAMTRLAELRGPVDTFFDEIMVMSDDVAERRNRLALLAAVRGLFLEVADVSELVVGND
ncbi:MAG: glycine--tRNA ligase subunit beta [Pseudomonadota bacterium]